MVVCSRLIKLENKSSIEELLFREYLRILARFYANDQCLGCLCMHAVSLQWLDDWGARGWVFLETAEIPLQSPNSFRACSSVAKTESIVVRATLLK